MLDAHDAPCPVVFSLSAEIAPVDPNFSRRSPLPPLSSRNHENEIRAKRVFEKSRFCHISPTMFPHSSFQTAGRTLVRVPLVLIRQDFPNTLLGADPKSAVSGKFDVAVLPRGGDDGDNAACLGGWQLMVSAYSKVPDAAADLVRYLSSAEIQKRIAIHFSVLPTRPALYSDPDVLAKNPFFKIMLNVFENAVARPSSVTGADYNQLSTALFQNVNNVLTGAESGKDAVVKVEEVAKRIID